MALTRQRGGVIAPQIGIAALVLAFAPAAAQTSSGFSRQLKDMRREVDAQRILIEGQATRLAQQQREIEELRSQATAAGGVNRPRADTTTVGNSPADGVAVAQSSVPSDVVPQSGPLPNQPVGEQPKPTQVDQQVAAVPKGMGVLTRAGRFILEPSIEYSNSTNNRLVFQGIELIPGIQIGLIDASNASRDTLVATAAVRYGITNSLEFEANVPYLVRSDRVEAVKQQDDSTTQTSSLNGRSIGDVEFGLRYQLNRSAGEHPIFISSLDVKTDTGRSPFSVPFNEFGVATGLATGSGFWAVQPGISFLLPSDPAVIFGGISYLYQIPRNINRTVDGVLIARVDPGDAVSGNIGFGFALNPRFSFSLGYRHTYIFPMRWTIEGATSRSNRLQVGSFLMGMSYRLTDRKTLDFGLEIGATRDAPDVNFVFRVPISSK